MVSSISIDDFLKLPSDIHVIDIRSSQSYNNNHIPGAIHIPFEKLLVNPAMYLKPNIRYYIYCQKGISSRKLSTILNQMGYQTMNLTGGYEEWIMKK